MMARTYALRPLHWAALIAAAALLASCGSLTKERIVIARATELPAEVAGMARVLTEDPVRVGIVGTDVVEERSVAGYILLHEADVAQLVRNTEELLRLQEAAEEASGR